MLWLVVVAVAAVPCWESDGEGSRRWEVSIPAGGKASFSLGEGSLLLECLGGIVTSAGGAPEWRLTLHADSAGHETVYPATYLVNASSPFPAVVHNTNDSATQWHLSLTNLNYLRAIVVNLTVTSLLSPTAHPTQAPDTTIAYSEGVARVALIYSSAAYTSPETIKDWRLNASCRAATSSFTCEKVFDGRNYSYYTPFGYVGVDHARQWIVVAFKGTNGTKDTVTDLIQVFKGGQYYQTKCAINAHVAGMTHSGFCTNYKVLQALGIVPFVIKLMGSYPGYAVLTTGHSLGGAINTLFFTDLTSTLSVSHAAWLRRIISYTFGQPRVGDSGLAFNLATMFRVVHANDWIVHLCPCCADGAYCLRAETCPFHVPQEIWYPNNEMSNYTVCSAITGEDPVCSNGQAVTLSVQDHLYYFGINVGSYCYPQAEYASYRIREAETTSWLGSLTDDERRKRAEAIRLEP